MDKNSKLFIVADSIEHCQILENYLAETNWDVSKFDNPDEALEKIEAEHPRVVVVDLPLDFMQEKFGLSPPVRTPIRPMWPFSPEVDPREVAKVFS